jgi:rhamnose transport system ATP-binding protein
MPAIEFRHLSKSFGAVAALSDVSCAIEQGEAHAIVGENGAGKSTLLKILAGSLQPDRGELRLDGAPAALRGPREAMAHGIAFVHQEMLAFPNLSVAANIFAGRELTGRLGVLRDREMRERARTLLARLHVPADPDTLVERLPVAWRQLLQVARALAMECRTLALDEPTTSLTDAESSHLFAVLDDLRQSGVTLIYVSHRLPEVFRLCDRITVLRDGRSVCTLPRRGVSHDDVVKAMVGRDVPARAAAARSGTAGLTRLRIDRLTRRPCFEDISLHAAAGEIVGLFGLVGAGRSELLETIVGLHAADRGTIEIEGGRRRFASPRDAARSGVALVPEDRQRQGLFFNLSLAANLAVPGAEARRAVLVGRQERRDAEGLLARWRIKAPSPDALPGALSGGNQQKVVLAKWLALEPRVLLLDEPTKGVDVGAKYDIHAIVRELAARGAACVVSSSDLPEVLAMADRILVMRAGRLAGEILAADAGEEQVMRLAATEPGAAA